MHIMYNTYLLWPLCSLQMNNYTKGKNVEQVEVLDSQFESIFKVGEHPWMKMNPGSKLRNFIDSSASALESSGCVLISGYGQATIKVFSEF